MGTLTGHLLPGSFFIVIAIWWSINIFVKYFRSLNVSRSSNSSSSQYANQVSHNPTNFKLPLESTAILLATTFGIIGETWTGFRGGEFVNIIPNGHHIVMYAFFWLYAIADFCIHCQVGGVPDESNYVLAILAVSVECFLFANHLHDGMRDDNNIQLHTLLVYSIAFCIIASSLEALCHKKLMALALLRCVAFLWQGVWFFHLGFTLFPTELPSTAAKHNDHNHHTQMINIIHFLSYLIGCILLVSLEGVVIYRCCLPKRKLLSRRKASKTAAAANGISANSSRYDDFKFKKLPVISDEDEEEPF